MSPPGIEPVSSSFPERTLCRLSTGAGTHLVCILRYFTCMCKLLTFRCSRSVQMLHNIKKNYIDIFEVHVHVSSFQIHVHVQLHISLKCTDARPQIIWSYMHACTFGTPNYWKKWQITLIKKVLILLIILLFFVCVVVLRPCQQLRSNSFVIGSFKYTCTWREPGQCQHLLHPVYWRQQDFDVIWLL